MTAVVIGLIFILFGGYGFFHWFHDFLTVLRGFGPISIFIGGLVALISGIASLRPKRTNENDKK